MLIKHHNCFCRQCASLLCPFILGLKYRGWRFADNPYQRGITFGITWIGVGTPELLGTINLRGLLFPETLSCKIKLM